MGHIITYVRAQPPGKGSAVSETFAFTYEEEDGSEGTIALESMRKLWIDRDRTGVVFAEPAAEGDEVLYEVVLDDHESVTGMAHVMQTLLEVDTFELLESPVSSQRPLLVLEFRYPNPHAVSLAWSA
jgi:hypothetical protein